MQHTDIGISQEMSVLARCPVLKFSAVLLLCLPVLQFLYGIFIFIFSGLWIPTQL